jgi:hypothetical protein
MVRRRVLLSSTTAPAVLFIMTGKQVGSEYRGRCWVLCRQAELAAEYRCVELLDVGKLESGDRGNDKIHSWTMTE